MPILQKSLPFHVRCYPRLTRLPEIMPLQDDGWCVVDDAFEAQMAERDRLILGAPELVHRLLEVGLPLGDAVLFSIHTYVVRIADLPDAPRVALAGAGMQ